MYDRIIIMRGWLIHMSTMWGMLIIGLLLLLSPFSFVVGFTMACMAGICLTLYYLSENGVIGKQKRDPSEIPLKGCINLEE